MTAQTAQRVKPGALFTYQESPDLPILTVEVVRLDTEDGAAICVESLSTDSTTTDAMFDITILEDGAFTYVGDVRTDAEHLAQPRVGDLFLYRLEPMKDWPNEGQILSEVMAIYREGMVDADSYCCTDTRGWREVWSPAEITSLFTYAGHVRPGSESVDV